jgi:hypothetical protein
MTTAAKLQNALTSAEDGLTGLYTFVRFCEAAISLAPLISRIPELLENLTKQGMAPMPEEVAESVRKDAEATKLDDGQDRDYVSYLHGIAIVKACSVIETAVDDVAYTLLSDRDYWSKLESLGKLRANKVDLIGLLKMSHAQQTAYLF